MEAPPTVPERALELAWRLAYIALVAVMLWTFLPAGTREAFRQVIQAQLWAYRHGLWQVQQDRTPSWKREALEVRGKLKRGQAAA